MFKDIILAEDDEDDRLLFIEALTHIPEKIPVEVATNGDELMSKLNARRQAPEMIFLDLNMPFKNGFQCLKEINEDDRFKRSKIIILTTSRNPADITQAYSLGATLFVTKPADFSALQSTLKKIINSEDPGVFKKLQSVL